VRSIIQAGEMPSLVDENAPERILIDFGGKSTKVLIVKRDSTAIFQIIAIGSEDFRQVIQHKWPALKDKAEQALFSAGSLNEKGLLPLTHRLNYAIKKIVDHHTGPVKSSINAPYPEIAICGGGIFIPGLAGHLQNELGMRLLVYNPLQYLGEETDKQNPSQLIKASLFAAAHGLAIRH
jgi:Tfp pilus assembly PilM family ATPase